MAYCNCNSPTDNEPGQQYSGGTITSGVRDPDVIQTPSNQAVSPVEGWIEETTAGSGSTSENSTLEGCPVEESG
ncbi:hypothetical protein NDU88_005206 [Pleurodeles waltl]|uniref:Uncharacterized protein n=1 Tax=Pleurodeles waltl TaxID=8319 RepID=A0AAV7QFC2_PLEWA|nr:hypothetical protein NDU88_005206 [Pleurodeles waltl]